MSDLHETDDGVERDRTDTVVTAAVELEPPPTHPGGPGASAGGIAPLDERRRLAYLILNGSTAPLWLAMIIAPRARLTATLVRAATPLLAGLGVAYTALLAAGVVRGGERLDVSDPDSVRRALASPDAFLAGWTHYLAFDLFVGRWIWQQSLDAGRTSRLALFLTWMAGPMGLTLHLAQRRRWR